MKLHCIVCKKELENLSDTRIGHAPYVHPNDGTAFMSYGHYGSAVTDYCNGTMTEICICDPCIVEHEKLTYITLPKKS